MKKLYRSNTKKMLAGVLGGFSNFFNIDVTIIRVLFIIFGVFANIAAIIIYIMAAIIMPKNPNLDK